MALFRGHRFRALVVAGLLFLSGHHLIKRMPESMHAFTLTQTAIAIIAVSTLMLLVLTHHRRQGRVLTQTQEELLLLAGFALFSVATLVAYRAFGQRSVQTGSHNGAAAQHGVKEAIPRTSLSPYGHGYGGLEPHRVTRLSQRVVVEKESPQISPTPWTCPEDAVKCVVEEYYY